MSKSTKRSAQPIRIATQTEIEFMHSVIKPGREIGWLVYHDYHALWNGRGFLDTVWVHPLVHLHPRLLLPNFFIAEFKAEDGELSLEQIVWMQALQANGVEVHVWKPGDIDEIAERLQVV